MQDIEMGTVLLLDKYCFEDILRGCRTSETKNLKAGLTSALPISVTFDHGSATSHPSCTARTCKENLAVEKK